MTAPKATSAALAASVAAVARGAYVARQLLARRAVLAARQTWSRIDNEAIRQSWQRSVGPSILTMTTDAQTESAAAANTTVTAMLVAQGVDASPAVRVAPQAFAGVASDGRDLPSLLELSNVYALRRIGAGQAPGDAIAYAGRWLELVVGLQVVDAGRVASGVAIASRPWVTGWIRMLSPPSCSRCVVLAGKWFGWNDGFERHPRCDCLHIPAAEDTLHDLRTDPRAYFNSLSRLEQDATFGKTGAQAIRDGADIGQVVNARDGMYTASVGGRQVLATHSSAKRSPHGLRLMPEQIYEIAGDNRAEAIRLLTAHGYLR
jgi:hypothetical protein